jgi:PD-(D/E)XK nuclease superfamily
MTTTMIEVPVDRAGGLASSIQIPKQLPRNYKNEPLRHLSHSSVNAFRLCPESFRRSYICGEWGPPSGEQFVGNRVDDAVSRYYQHLLHGEQLTPQQLTKVFNDIWKAEVQREQKRHGGVRWPTDLPAGNARQLGLKALELTFDQLVPRLGQPLAVQRKFEFKLHPDLEWTIVGAVDLDTVRELTVFVSETGEPHPTIRDQGEPEPTVEFPYLEAPAEFRTPAKRGRETLEPADAIDTYHREWEEYQARHAQWRADGDVSAKEPKEPKPLPVVAVPVRVITAHAVTREVQGITDYKVKTTLMGDSTAARDMQAGLYLAERWLAGYAVFDFRFAQVGKPKEGRRVNMSTSLVRTTYSEHDMRTVLARIAQTASEICSKYNDPEIGPERPWGWASHEWKCDYCTHGPRGTNSCPFAMTGP